MSFAGTYKVIKVMQYKEGEGLVFEEVEKVLEKATDEHEKRMLEQTINSLLIVGEDASISQAIKIPEGTPAEEIEKAKSHGMKISEDGTCMIMKSDEGKIEDGNLYLYDAKKMLTGEEWVKISTDNEGELNLVASLFSKVE